MPEEQPTNPTSGDQAVIVPFFSLKGGTGRTTAMSNTAYFLARSGARVLVVDGDVDSLGVSVLPFFQPQTGKKRGSGLIGVFQHARQEMNAGETTPEGARILHFPDHAEFVHAAFGRVDFHWQTESTGETGWLHKVKSAVEAAAQETAGSGIVTAQQFCEALRDRLFRAVQFLELDTTHNVTPAPDGDWEAVLSLSSANGQAKIEVRVASGFGENDWYTKTKEDIQRPEHQKTWTHHGGVWVLHCLRDGGTSAVFDEVAFEGRPDKPMKDRDEVKVMQALLRTWADAGGTKLFDYILVDCRSGEDPFSIHAVLPVASAIAIAAHVNSQGTTLTTEFVKKLRDGGMGFSDEAATERLKDPRLAPIIWFSQILPSGENFLRRNRIANFIKELGSPTDCATEAAITMIYYNSSLPLEEDLLGIREVSSRKSPYWELADQVLALRERNYHMLYSEIVSAWNCLEATWKGAKESAEVNLPEAFRKFVNILDDYARHVPVEAAYFLTRLAAHRGMFGDLLLLRDEKTLMHFLALYELTPVGEIASECLSGLAQTISGIHRSKPLEFTERWSSTDEDGVAKIEGKANTIHVASRHFEFDLAPSFGVVVKQNIHDERAYHYYTASSVKEMRRKRGMLVERLNKWEDEETDKKAFYKVTTLPTGFGVRFHESLPLDDVDIVVYEHPSGAVEHSSNLTVALFPKPKDGITPPVLVINDPVLAKTLFGLLRSTILR